MRWQPSITLREAGDLTQVIYATAQQLLSKALAEQEKPIRLIGVRASSLVGQERQLPMFRSETDRPERVDKAIDEIHRKYGPSAVRTADDVLSGNSREDSNY